MYRKLLKSASVILLLVGAGSAARAQNVFTPGWLKEEFYSAISGGVDGFIGDPKYGTPDAVKWWNSFGPYNAGNNQGDNFGEEITGYVIPPATGNYKFYLRSDDPSRLFISTDDKRANLGTTAIAEQTGCCNAFTDAEGTLSSTPIALTAGKKYYIQALHVEGGGDDYVQVAWRTPADASLNDPPTTMIPAAYIGVDAPSAGASVKITTQPSAASTVAGQTASFTVGYTATVPGTTTIVTSTQTQDADAATDASIVWLKNGVAIPGQSKATYTTPILTLADTGAKFSAQVSVPGAVATSSDAAVTVTADSTAPTIVKAAGAASLGSIIVTFDGAMDKATAETAGNYTVTPSLAVSKATLSSSDPSLKTVVITTAAQTPGTKYTLAITGVKDLSGNTIAANANKDFYSAVFATGATTMNYWYNNSANNIAALQADPRFPNSPDFSMLLTDWEYPNYNPPWVSPAVGNNEAGSNYGNQIVGWFIPATTGNYVFFTCSDDPSNLYLSTDDTPANKKLIAQETNWSNPRQWTTSAGGTDVTVKRSDQNAGTEWSGGATISLTAGKKYYMESQHTEGGGGDNVDVTFIKAGDPDPTDGDASKLTGALIGTTIPADGILASYGPTGTTVSPNAPVAATIIAGLAKIDSTTVTLMVDGAKVTPTLTANGSSTTVSYTPAKAFVTLTKHSAELDYPLADGSITKVPWNFTISPVTMDTVKGYVGLVKGAKWSPDKGGHTGNAGDFAMDSNGGAGWVSIDPSFLNPVNDTLSVSVWVQHPKSDIANGSAFWFDGSDQGRAFQSHIPWSDDTIYFDTAGCCDGTTQRINANINTLTGYVDDTFWTNWHHFAYTKKADQKNIYIDGKLFLNGSSTGVLSTNLNALGLLTDGNPGGDYMHGLIDDFAIFKSELSAADVSSLAAGNSPTKISGLAAYWPFNDPVSAPPVGADISNLTVSGDRKSLTVTYTGTLQSADTVTGAWTDVANATSPATISVTGGTKFYRVH